MSHPESSPQSIEILVKELNSKDATQCKHSREELVGIGSPAIPYLAKTMATGTDWTRWGAAKTLVEIADAEAVPALVDALRDKSFDVRWLAAKGLIAIGWKSIIPVIESLMEHPGSVWMRDGAHHVLHDLADGRFKEPLEPMLETLEGVEPAVQIPLVGRRVLKELAAIEAKMVREEEEARRRAEEEAEQEA